MRLVFELLDVKKFWIFLTAPKLTYKWRGWTARQKRSWKLTWRSWKLTWTKTTVIEMLIYPFVLVRTISLNQSPETAGPKWSIPIVGLPLEESSKKEIPTYGWIQGRDTPSKHYIWAALTTTIHEATAIHQTIPKQIPGPKPRECRDSQ